MSARHDSHLNAEILQDFLEEALPGEKTARVEEHLHRCRRCSAELEAWRALMGDLDELPATATPSRGFADRVMEQVPVRRTVPQRVGDWFRGWAQAVRPDGAARPSASGSGRRASHPSPGLLQDYAEGILAGRATAALGTHLEACTPCSGEVVRWRSMMGSLGELGHFAPAAGFQDRVMAQVRVAPAGAEERSRSGAWATVGAWSDRAWDRLNGLVPETAGARAAAAACLLLPVAVVAAGLLYLVRHPLLDPLSVASFLWWRASEEIPALAAIGAAWLLESAVALQLMQLVATALEAPGAAATAVLAVWTLSMAAVWVLYRNLFTPWRETGSHA